MRNQKKNPLPTFVLCLVMMLFAQLATAQNATGMKDKTPEERAQFQTGLIKSKLSLDSAQVALVQVINLKYALKNDRSLKVMLENFPGSNRSKPCKKKKTRS